HDGGYGWVCVACMFFISANTWGVNGVRTTSSFARTLLRLTSNLGFWGLPCPLLSNRYFPWHYGNIVCLYWRSSHVPSDVHCPFGNFHWCKVWYPCYPFD